MSAAKYIEYIKDKKSFYIQASAGTGKTYSIMQMVKVLLAGEMGEDVSKSKLLTLDKILIVTYTEKAVGELKDRIRKELKKAIENKQDKQGNKTKYTDEQVNLFSQALKISSNAPIFTIHSFCQTILKEAAFLAKVPTNLDVVDEGEIKEMLDEKLRDEYAAEAYGENIDISKLLKDNSGFADVLKSTSDKYYLDKTGNPVDDIIRIFKYDTEYPKEKIYIKNKIEEIYKDWLFEKQYRRLQSFNDMIRNLREAVCAEDGNNKLVKYLRDKYRLAIIDEFQDTNQKQWDIFEKIFLDEKNNLNDNIKHSLVVVGDPKQSIYSFQGADINVYSNATIDKIEESDTLKTNYRSTDAIINACNELFDESNNSYFKSREIEFKNSESPRDTSIKDSTDAKWENEDGDEVKPIILALKKNDKGEDATIDQYEFAEFAVKKIKELHDGGKNGKLLIYDKDLKNEKQEKYREVKYSDFAILCRTRTELFPITNQLDKYGIPYVKYKDDKLFIAKECADWIALLQAIDANDFAGGNRKILQKALFTKFFNKKLNELEDIEYNNPECPKRVMIQNWKKLANEKKWFELIDSIIDKSGIEQTLNAPKDQNMLFKFRQIGDYIQEYLVSNKGDIKNLIEHLTGLNSKKFDEEAEDDGNIVSIGTDNDCVKIMTIHASKGLEFPIVISVAGFKEKYTKVPHCWQGYSDVSKIHTNNGVGKFLDVISEDEFTKTDIYSKRKDYDKENQSKDNFCNKYCFKTIYNKEQNEEFKRLFYVDYTRAGSLLVLPYYTYSKCFNFIKNSLDRIKDNDDIVEKIDVTNYVPKENPPLYNNKPTLYQDNESEQDKKDRLNKTCNNSKSSLSYKNSYSSLKDIFTDIKVDVNAQPIFNQSLYIACDNNPEYKKIRGSAFFGNALHEIFEKANFADFNKDNHSEKYDENYKLIKRILSHSGLYQTSGEKDKIDAIYKMIECTLNAKLLKIRGSDGTDETFSLYELSEDEKCTEAEFLFNSSSDGKWIKQYFDGFIDLLFTLNDNGKKRYCILDWKSDTFEDGKFYSAPYYLKEKVDSEYSIQRVLYSYCLIKWLSDMYDISESDAFYNYFGGIYYAFARGTKPDTSNGIYSQTWQNYSDLKQAYDVIASKIKNISINSSEEK